MFDSAKVVLIVVNVCSTIFSGSIMDKTGRRTLLLRGTSIMASALLVLSTVLLFANGNETAQGVVAILAVLVFVFGYAVGLGAGSNYYHLSDNCFD